MRRMVRTCAVPKWNEASLGMPQLGQGWNYP